MYKEHRKHQITNQFIRSLIEINLKRKFIFLENLY